MIYGNDFTAAAFLLHNIKPVLVIVKNMGLVWGPEFLACLVVQCAAKFIDQRHIMYVTKPYYEAM